MKKRLLSGFLIGGCLAGLAAWMLSLPAVAAPCTVNCKSGQIQFTPGDRITIQVINVGNQPISLEQPPLVGPRVLYTGNTLEFQMGWSTQPNPSIFFWSSENLPVRARLGRAPPPPRESRCIAPPVNPAIAASPSKPMAASS